MRIGIFDSAVEIAELGANLIIDRFRAKPGSNLGVATGSTPLALYAVLREAHQQGRFTLVGSKAFALDEYVGLPPEHPESYRAVLSRELVDNDATGLKPENLYTPNGMAEDLEAAAAAHDRAIVESGGVDVQILGIGSDGHIGFNEPGAALDSRTHQQTLTEQTRRDNSRFFDGDINQVPTRCLTQGLGTIMDARELLMLALGENKAQAVRDMLEGPVDPACPASVIQNHPSVTVLLDTAAASLLENPEQYRDEVVQIESH